MKSICNGKEASPETFFEVTFRRLLRAKHSCRPCEHHIHHREGRSVNGLVGVVAHYYFNQSKGFSSSQELTSDFSPPVRRSATYTAPLLYRTSPRHATFTLQSPTIYAAVYHVPLPRHCYGRGLLTTRQVTCVQHIYVR